MQRGWFMENLHVVFMLPVNKYFAMQYIRYINISVTPIIKYIEWYAIAMTYPNIQILTCFFTFKYTEIEIEDSTTFTVDI